MKFIFLLLLISNLCTAQYIGVRARYTETRLVDDSPNPPKRENRLVLSFYTVTFNGTGNDFTPVVLSNYDIWVYKEGLQFGNPMDRNWIVGSLQFPIGIWIMERCYLLKHSQRPIFVCPGMILYILIIFYRAMSILARRLYFPCLLTTFTIFIVVVSYN